MPTRLCFRLTAEHGRVAGPRLGEGAARGGNEADTLFLQALLVPPNKFRPTNKLGDVVSARPLAPPQPPWCRTWLDFCNRRMPPANARLIRHFNSVLPPVC